MDTDSFVIQVKTVGFYKDIANDVEKWFVTSNYDEYKAGKRPLSSGKNKKIIGILKMKYEERLWKNFVHLEKKHMHT